jgi:hypothetical protein
MDLFSLILSSYQLYPINDLKFPLKQGVKSICGRFFEFVVGSQRTSDEDAYFVEYIGMTGLNIRIRIRARRYSIRLDRVGGWLKPCDIIVSRPNRLAGPSFLGPVERTNVRRVRVMHLEFWPISRMGD